MPRDGAREAGHDVEETIARIAQRVFSLISRIACGARLDGVAVCERTGLMVLDPSELTELPDPVRPERDAPRAFAGGSRGSQQVVGFGSAGATPLGRYLALMAEFEEASVTAFELLARELAAHGAPDPLIADALVAQKHEVRHAAMIGALARARGGMPRALALPTQAVRCLREVARDNAVEGCVRETYGALIGAHQAAFATDDALRCAMVRIAAEEARHAALAHRIHAWIMPLLDESTRLWVHAAQRAAIASLDPARTEVTDHAVAAPAGLPHPVLARRMLFELAATLWSPALSGR